MVITNAKEMVITKVKEKNLFANVKDLVSFCRIGIMFLL